LPEPGVVADVAGPPDEAVLVVADEVVGRPGLGEDVRDRPQREEEGDGPYDPAGQMRLLLAPAVPR